jgi:hypothetical protein
MTPGGGQPQGNGLACIIGVGHEVDRLFDTESLDEREEFVGKRSLIAVTEYEPFVNPTPIMHAIPLPWG